MSIHRFYNDIEEWEYGSASSIYFLYQGMQKYNVAYKEEKNHRCNRTLPVNTWW